MTTQEETVRRHRAFMAKLAALLAAVMLVVRLVWGAMIPPAYGPIELWVPKGNPLVALLAMIPGIAWGMSLQGLLELVKSRRMTSLEAYRSPRPSQILSDGTRVSIIAGVLEEISFRWLLFLLCLFGYAALNLPFKAVGLNLDPLVHLGLLTPIANVFTFGMLQDALYDPAGWHVAAAMLTANAFFRNGHKYQGLPGFVNSWFMGMYLFWIMLDFGLPYAIIAHVLYDLAVFGVMAFAASARLRGWVALRSEP